MTIGRHRRASIISADAAHGRMAIFTALLLALTLIISAGGSLAELESLTGERHPYHYDPFMQSPVRVSGEVNAEKAEENMRADHPISTSLKLFDTRTRQAIHSHQPSVDPCSHNATSFEAAQQSSTPSTLPELTNAIAKHARWEEGQPQSEPETSETESKIPPPVLQDAYGGGVEAPLAPPAVTQTLTFSLTPVLAPGRPSSRPEQARKLVSPPPASLSPERLSASQGRSSERQGNQTLTRESKTTELATEASTAAPTRSPLSTTNQPVASLDSSTVTTTPYGPSARLMKGSPEGGGEETISSEEGENRTESGRGTPLTPAVHTASVASPTVSVPLFSSPASANADEGGVDKAQEGYAGRAEPPPTPAGGMAPSTLASFTISMTGLAAAATPSSSMLASATSQTNRASTSPPPAPIPLSSPRATITIGQGYVGGAEPTLSPVVGRDARRKAGTASLTSTPLSLPSQSPASPPASTRAPVGRVPPSPLAFVPSSRTRVNTDKGSIHGNNAKNGGAEPAPAPAETTLLATYSTSTTSPSLPSSLATAQLGEVSASPPAPAPLPSSHTRVNTGKGGVQDKAHDAYGGGAEPSPTAAGEVPQNPQREVAPSASSLPPLSTQTAIGAASSRSRVNASKGNNVVDYGGAEPTPEPAREGDNASSALTRTTISTPSLATTPTPTTTRSNESSASPSAALPLPSSRARVNTSKGNVQGRAQDAYAGGAEPPPTAAVAGADNASSTSTPSPPASTQSTPIDMAPSTRLSKATFVYTLDENRASPTSPTADEAPTSPVEASTASPLPPITAMNMEPTAHSSVSALPQHDQSEGGPASVSEPVTSNDRAKTGHGMEYWAFSVVDALQSLVNGSGSTIESPLNATAEGVDTSPMGTSGSIVPPTAAQQPQTSSPSPLSESISATPATISALASTTSSSPPSFPSPSQATMKSSAATREPPRPVSPPGPSSSVGKHGDEGVEKPDPASSQESNALPRLRAETVATASPVPASTSSQLSTLTSPTGRQPKLSASQAFTKWEIEQGTILDTSAMNFTLGSHGPEPMESNTVGIDISLTSSQPPAVIVEASGYDAPPAAVSEPAMLKQRDSPQRAESANSTSTTEWHPFEMRCSEEVDDKGEELCAEWARSGYCTTNRPTMFLFCRRTCLCVGPPSARRSRAPTATTVAMELATTEANANTTTLSPTATQLEKRLRARH